MAQPPTQSHNRRTRRWWEFLDADPHAAARGVFRATGVERIDRLYVPLVNEAGMLSWTSPRLHGSPAASHHEYLSLPLTAEDLPHTLVHRDFWLLEPDQLPFSASGLCPEGLLDAFRPRPDRSSATIEAGPGWFTLLRRGPHGRYTIRVTLWCPADVKAKVELMRIDVINTASRRLAFDSYAAIPGFARSADRVRDHRHVTALLHRVSLGRYGVIARPTMSFDERGHTMHTTHYAYLALGPGGRAPASVWGIEAQFLGEGGSFAAPTAVWRRHAAPPTDERALAGHEVIGGFRFPRCILRPGAQASFLVLGGISSTAREPLRWIRRFTQPASQTRSLEVTKRVWLKKIHRVRFQTADRQLDQWLTWVGFQPILRRLYGNSYLPQFDYGRGGRGWRDLWQDGLALLLSDPVSVRPHLLHNLGGIRIDGSNATIIANDGSFIADRNHIPRTWMDHGVWPTYTTLLYLDQTGDMDMLFRPRAYFRDPQLFRCRQQDPRWSESYGFELRTRRGHVYRGSVLEHLLVQNLTAFFNVGEHNLCRLEGADWNDGLDMATHRGESVAFSAFYAWNLQRLAELLRVLALRGVHTVSLAHELRSLLDRLPGEARVPYASATAKRNRLQRYLSVVARDVSGRIARVRVDDVVRDLLAKSEDLAERIRTQEWIHAGGEQYFNGYYDDAGRRVEGKRGRRIRMTLTGQVFALMSEIATEEQLERTIRAVNRWLRDRRSGGIRLNTDFGQIQPTLGRAFSFAYGEKENGAVFSHMAVLYACALYMRRRPKEGRKVWTALYRMATNQSTAKIFPCLPEYFNAQGRGMYGYLTGSASWLIYLLLTQVYGIRGDQGDLVIDPQLTTEDFAGRSELRVEIMFAGRPLRIVLANPHRLPPARYTVVDVRHGRTRLPCALRPAGGVWVMRRSLERLPTAARTELRVALA